MSPVAIEIGPLTIRWYGILISLALGLGTILAYRRATKRGINPEHILNLILIAVPSALFGARLYYVIFNWPEYVQNGLLEVIAVWHGGLAIHGGLLGGVLAGYLYIRSQKLNFWQMADIIAPSLILGQAIGRWGNFFNQEAYGGVVSLEFISHFPDFIQKGMYIGGAYHHPTFLYESLWNLAVFIFLLWFSRRKLPAGTIFLSYLALYSLGRFWIEGLRTDSLMLGPLRAAQVVSVILIVLAGILLAWRVSKREKY
ncbi:prolipoprotein diacylglyceryl transferase [Bacillota bacterium LX-D]|nr:prolipoprotein diacylglyceryl transferase [Bacillota bacterium LX-D]